MEIVKINDWEKLDVRIGKVLEVKDHPNADKLYVLKVSFGDHERQIVSGIREAYTKDKLKNKKFAFIVNLEPINLRGEKSEGMILAAVEDKKISLLKPDKTIKEGSKIQ